MATASFYPVSSLATPPRQGIETGTRAQSATRYDQTAYLGMPFPQTHPDRLATMSFLYGLEPAYPGYCEVLEIGCGDGGNLIPMAYAAPGSRFVGIDLAATAIDQARQQAAALNLTNVEFHVADISTVGRTLGGFDYVIAHGIYSWVPDDVRDSLVQLVAASLKPRGVGYLSYNSYPGSYFRTIVRDLCLYHTNGVDDPKELVKWSKEVLGFMVQNAIGDEPYRNLLARELKSFQERQEAHIYHDEFSPVNHPVYFTQFASHIERHGLKFVCEAHYVDMWDGLFSKEAMEILDTIPRQQYLDFLRCRRFRQTLVCQDAHSPAAVAGRDRVSQLHVSSSRLAGDRGNDAAVGDYLEVRRDDGPTLKVPAVAADLDIVAQVLRILQKQWPNSVPAAELANRLGHPGRLNETLLSLYGFDLVKMNTLPRQARQPVLERPVADKLARMMARAGNRITSSALHRSTHVSPVGQALLPLLDGSRDVGDLWIGLNRPELGVESLEAELWRLNCSGLLEAELTAPGTLGEGRKQCL